MPEHSFMLNLGLAFGEGFMRIPTPNEVGFIKTWHALLMGMIDPVLDCQGIMRADDGTPMFRFGYPDARDPSIIRRNNVAYRVGEHFWEKNGNLYRDTDLSTPVLDLHGEAPLTFAERAAMHDCPTLPGLGSPCQVALNLRPCVTKIEQGDSPVQVVLTEDAQILACLNHLSPLKAAAMFSGDPGGARTPACQAAPGRPLAEPDGTRSADAPRAGRRRRPWRRRLRMRPHPSRADRPRWQRPPIRLPLDHGQRNRPPRKLGRPKSLPSPTNLQSNRRICPRCPDGPAGNRRAKPQTTRRRRSPPSASKQQA